MQGYAPHGVLGEIGTSEDMPLLQRAYGHEDEDNVRTNIVWAQFMIDPTQIDEENFKDFLLDDYYVIPLVALKRLSGMPHVAGKHDFIDYYDKHENQLVNLEMLRNIRSFQIPQDINVKLEAALKATDHVLEKSTLIRAIGASNQTDSMTVLMDYYRECESDILEDEVMADSMVSAISSLGQSDAYEILQEIYTNQRSPIIRWKIIESLAMAGGPNSLSVLRSIQANEQDYNIKDATQSFIDMTRVTTN